MQHQRRDGEGAASLLLPSPSKWARSSNGKHDRFTEDVMYKLNEKEKAEVVANCAHLRRLKFSPKLPSAFTEHGAIILAAVLNSPIAVQASIQVVRVFIRLRQMLASNTELSRNLAGTTRMAYKTAREFSSRFIPGNKAIRCY